MIFQDLPYDFGILCTGKNHGKPYILRAWSSINSEDRRDPIFSSLEALWTLLDPFGVYMRLHRHKSH